LFSSLKLLPTTKNSTSSFISISQAKLIIYSDYPHNDLYLNILFQVLSSDILVNL
jgi:hypothetical protein